MLLDILSKTYPVFILSARNDCARLESEYWLSSNQINMHTLKLRSDEEMEAMTNTEYKVASVGKWINEGYTPVLYIDDWLEACLAVEAQHSIPTLCISPPYEKAAPGL